MKMDASPKETMTFFFKCAGIGMILWGLRSDWHDVSLRGFINNYIVSMLYMIVSGIWFGVSSMAGYIIISYFKNKLNHE